MWTQREMAVTVNSLGTSVGAVLTYSAKVMVGRVVLMQPRLKLIQRAERRADHGPSCLRAMQA